MMLLVAPAGTLAPTSSVVAFGQPWFYLRLEAYRFIGLSEEAYGRSGDSRPEPHFRLLDRGSAFTHAMGKRLRTMKSILD